MHSLQARLAKTLDTERLHLELFDRSDAHYAILLAAMNSPTAHARMGDLGIRTPAQFDALNAATRLAPATLAGAGPVAVDADIYYLLRPKGGGHQPLVGGVSLAQRGPRLPPDVGWCVLEAHMGRGYAAEAARALVAYARDGLGVAEVMSWPGAGNEASRRTAERAGFVVGGEVCDAEGRPHVVYLLPGMDFEKVRGVGLSLFGEGGA